MKLINNRFKIIKKEEKEIFNHESYIVEDIKDNNTVKKLTLYELDKDEKTINYLTKNFIEISNISHRILLHSNNFHIVETINISRINSSLYFLIHEFHDGKLLYLEKENLNSKQKINILLELMNLIDYLHFKDFTYKCLSPDNIFINSNNEIKVRNLALTSERETHTFYQTMSEYFIAPELHNNMRHIKYKSDLFSLGVMIKYLFFKDYKKQNVNIDDFVDSLTLKSNKKELLLKMVKNLTINSPVKRNIKLRKYIDEIIKEFKLPYINSLKDERKKINNEIRLQGRDDELEKVIGNDALLKRGNKLYNAIFLAGVRGSGKTRFIKELDFRLRMKGRQIINLNIDSQDKTNSLNIKKLLNLSLAVASNNLVSKYNVEFDVLLSSYHKKGKENDHSLNYKTKYRIFDRITNYFIEISKSGILYIMVDNIHNSDKEFLSLLKYLILNLKDKPIVFIVSYLEPMVAVDLIFKNQILEWVDSSLNLKITLKDLKKNDFRNVISSKLGYSCKELSSFLYDLTGGNLLKLNYVIRDIYNKGYVDIDENGNWKIEIKEYEDVFIYSDIHDIFKKQLNSVSKKALDFINVASIFNKYILNDVIMEIINLNKVNNEEIIKELLEHKIIKENYYNNKLVYNFHNIELKKLLYYEMNKWYKIKLHENVSNIILEKVALEEDFILEELSFQLVKSNKENLALNIVLKRAKNGKNKLSNESLYLWELAYSLIKDDPLYRNNYKVLDILDNLIEIYNLKEKERDVYPYIKKLNRISKIQGNYFYIIKSKYYESDYFILRNELEDVSIKIKEIFDLSKKYNLYEGKMMGLYLESKIYLKDNSSGLFLKTCEEFILMAKNHKKEQHLGNVYNLLGIHYYLNGSITKAIKTFKESIKYFNYEKNIGELIKPINNIGGIYFEYFHDDEKALNFFEKGYNISEKYKLDFGISIFSLNMGIIYLEKLQIEKALKLLERSNEISEKRKDFRGVFLSTINLAITYLWKEDIESLYNLYIFINDKFNDNSIRDIELTSSYYDFLSKVYGYFGVWDEALKNTILSKNLYKDFNMKEYNKSILMEIYYNYCIKGEIDVSQMHLLRDVLKSYSVNSINNETLMIILKICGLSLLNKDLKLTHKLLYIYNNLQSSNELKILEIIRKSIEINIESNKKILFELESIDTNRYSLSVQNILNLSIGVSLFNNKYYKRAIYFLLKGLGNILSSIEYFEDHELVKEFIISRHGDLIKEYICRAIKLEFNKNIKFVKIMNVKKEDIYKCFDISDITTVLTDKQIDSIFYTYKKEYEVHDIEELLSTTSDNYKYNLDNILKYIANKTMAEKGFIILYDKIINEYRILSSLKQEDIKDLNLNKLVYLDRKKEGILLNKSYINICKQNMFKALSKEYMGILGVPIGTKMISPYINGDRRKEKTYEEDERFADERYKGYIYLETNSYINKFSHKNFNKLKGISKLVYLNVENYMLKNITNTDKLTNTMTRKYFDSSLQSYIDKDVDRNAEFTLLMLDLDDFKKINDTCGHLKGDNVLERIGLVLINNTRITDLVCRYGGDEFIIALLDTDLSQGIKIAEKIRRKVGNISISGLERKLSVAIGVSHYPTHSKLREILTKKGDEALYFAKDKLGKNSVAVWESSYSKREDDYKNYQEDSFDICSIDDKIALAIIKTTNLIKKSLDLKEKGNIFLDILIENLDVEEAHLTFIKGFKISDSIVKNRIKTRSSKTSKYKLNIINRALSYKKPECFIDWDNYDRINTLTGAPDWKSIIYVPLIKNGSIEGIVYTCISISEKEFKKDEFNLVQILSDIFLANF